MESGFACGLSTDQLHKLHEFIDRGGVLKLTDRSEWGLSNIFMEHFLTDLARYSQRLLVGSPTFLFYEEYLRADESGLAMATDSGAVAILRAVFSTETADVHYPLAVNDESPLRVDIVRKRLGRIVMEKGYVYLLKTHNEFSKDQKSTWRWLSTSTTNQLGGCVEVSPKDFLHPVCGPLTLMDL
jgi:hypothetical protein